MRNSGTDPSSVILSQTWSLKIEKSWPKLSKKQAKVKRNGVPSQEVGSIRCGSLRIQKNYYNSLISTLSLASNPSIFRPFTPQLLTKKGSVKQTLISFGNFAIVLTWWYRRASSPLPQKLEKYTMTSWNRRRVSRNMTYALQNMQFSQYFTTQFNISSLNLTGESDFLFYLLLRTTHFLWVAFNKVWMIIFFSVVNYMVRKFPFCSHLNADAIANIILLHIFIDLKKSLYFTKHDPEFEVKIFYSDRHFYNS